MAACWFRFPCGRVKLGRRQQSDDLVQRAHYLYSPACGRDQSQPLEYLLSTARSWQGSIGSFTVTIDKGAPKNLVSLCESGVRKTGPTTFEIRRTNYRPDGDLRVLLIESTGQ